MEQEPEWPRPPIRFEDLADALELLGRDAECVLRGWVLVPVTRLLLARPALRAQRVRD